jgi:hypothetical protein
MTVNSKNRPGFTQINNHLYYYRSRISTILNNSHSTTGNESDAPSEDNSTTLYSRVLIFDLVIGRKQRLVAEYSTDLATHFSILNPVRMYC